MGLAIPSDFPEEELAALPGEELPPLPTPDRLGPLTRLLPAPADRHGGVRLTSIAIHERATVVRWHALVEDGHPVDLDLALADDPGTDYGAARTGGGSGTDRVRSGATTFPSRSRRTPACCASHGARRERVHPMLRPACLAAVAASAAMACPDDGWD